MRAAVISLLLCLSVACKPDALVGDPQETLHDAGSGYDALTPAMKDQTERTRAILEERCGTCHRPDQEGATPEILAVFNLSDEIWWQNMTAERWSIMIDRLEGQNLTEAAEDIRALADEATHGPVQF